MTLLRHRHGDSELIGLNTLLAFDLGGVLAGLGCSTASSAAATGARGIATPTRHRQPSAATQPEPVVRAHASPLNVSDHTTCAAAPDRTRSQHEGRLLAVRQCSQASAVVREASSCWAAVGATLATKPVEPGCRRLRCRGRAAWPPCGPSDIRVTRDIRETAARHVTHEYFTVLSAELARGDLNPDA